MPKTKVTKSKVSITVDSSILDKLKKECDNRTMKLSSYIEKLIELGYKNEKK